MSTFTAATRDGDVWTVTATRDDFRSEQVLVMGFHESRELLFDFANRLPQGKVVSGATITVDPVFGLDVSGVSYTQTTVSCRAEPTAEYDHDYRVHCHVTIDSSPDVIAIACTIRVRD